MPSNSTLDWTTISSLATGAGTLVLAAATFAAVRSANRTARLTEASHQAELRPLLLPSRLHDVEEKVGFVDGRWFKLAGGRGLAAVDGRRRLPDDVPAQRRYGHRRAARLAPDPRAQPDG